MEFTRGDTFAFKTLIKFKNNIPITKDDLKELYITCKKSEYSKEIIFQKEIEDVEIDAEGYCHVIFKPEDTECLEYGTYVFDIEITNKLGIRKTKFFEFTLTKETTFHNGGESNDE